MNKPYHIQVTPAVLRATRGYSSKQLKQLIQLADALAINPRPPGSRKIAGMTGLYCEEMDHLRIIYKIEDQEILLLLVRP